VAKLCGLRINDRPVPSLPNDRGCSAPYLKFLGPLG
jgi:hypothetical protein